AIFSRGFLTVDDHLILVDTADRVARGIPFPHDFKRSILYPGSVALVMDAMRALGNRSPDVEMLVLRLMHAAGALAGVYFAFRIVERVAGRAAALLGGLLVAAFFPLPVTSVHQFEEAVCQVPLLAGCWWLLKADDADRGAKVWSFLSGAAIRGGRMCPRLAVPTLAFLVASSLVPNKQERFLLPVLPALLILGAVGISNVRDWFARRGWSSVYNWSWAYFVVVNTLLLGI